MKVARLSLRWATLPPSYKQFVVFLREIFRINRLLPVVRSEGLRTPTMLLTATSRQRVYQFRHERFFRIGTAWPDRINGAM